MQSTIAAIGTKNSDIDDVIHDTDDFYVPLNEVDVWIDPLVRLTWFSIRLGLV
jgi:hypothetical protein